MSIEKGVVYHVFEDHFGIAESTLAILTDEILAYKRALHQLKCPKHLQSPINIIKYDLKTGRRLTERNGQGYLPKNIRELEKTIEGLEKKSKSK